MTVFSRAFTLILFPLYGAFLLEQPKLLSFLLTNLCFSPLLRGIFIGTALDWQGMKVYPKFQSPSTGHFYWNLPPPPKPRPPASVSVPFNGAFLLEPLVG